METFEHFQTVEFAIIVHCHSQYLCNKIKTKPSNVGTCVPQKVCSYFMTDWKVYKHTRGNSLERKNISRRVKSSTLAAQQVIKRRVSSSSSAQYEIESSFIGNHQN